MPPKTAKRKYGEYQEDQPRAATKQFQSWGEWQTAFNEKEKNGKRQFADTFKKNIDASRDEIHNLMNQCNQDLKDAGDSYAKKLRGVMASAKPDSRSTLHKGPVTRREHPLYDAGRQILQDCRSLVDVHEQAVSKTSAQSRSQLGDIRARWDKDTAEIEEVMRYGLSHGINIVDSLVIPSTDRDIKSQLLSPDHSVELGEKGRMAVDMYRKSMQRLGHVPTWGNVAKKNLEVFEGILEEISEDQNMADL